MTDSNLTIDHAALDEELGDEALDRSELPSVSWGHGGMSGNGGKE